jgi:hypothetical protein
VYSDLKREQLLSTASVIFQWENWPLNWSG